MIDEFHIMFMYRKIQAEAATTDIKTLNQLLKKFQKVVAERREEYYQEIGEKKVRKLRMKRLIKLMERDRVSPADLKCHCSLDLRYIKYYCYVYNYHLEEDALTL